jgi:GT2 family glycosyltransferase
VDLAIIVVNYRTARLTIGCLASLLDDPALPEGTHLMIVDGASGDGSTEAIAAAIEARNVQRRVSLLPLEVNGGFAYANNRAIEAIRARFGEPEFYLLLNPDTVVRASAVSRLLAFLKSNSDVGIAGARLEDPDGTPQACAFRFLSVASEFESEIRFGLVSRLLRRWSVVAQDLSDEPSRVDWVSGACMLVRSDVFKAIGLMDEAYFLYYEELDLTLRAARAGWECWYVPQSRVVHLVGQSTGVSKREGKRPRRPRYWFDSRRRYFVKNHGRLYAFMADLAWISGYVGWRIRQFLTGQKNEDPPMLLQDFLRHSFSFGKR